MLLGGAPRAGWSVNFRNTVLCLIEMVERGSARRALRGKGSKSSHSCLFFLAFAVTAPSGPCFRVVESSSRLHFTHNITLRLPTAHAVHFISSPNRRRRVDVPRASVPAAEATSKEDARSSSRVCVYTQRRERKYRYLCGMKFVRGPRARCSACTAKNENE